MRVLVFGAHPDDETFGCGGTIYKHVQRGDDVTVVCVTDGSGGGLGIDPEELAKTRKRELIEACNILGVKKVKLLDFKDGFLYVNPDTLAAVGQIIRSEKPERVYVHHGDAPWGEDNPDHINTYRLVMIAISRGPHPNYPQMGSEPWLTKEVYAFEVPIYPLHAPTSFVDITDVIDIKLKALRRHESQAYWEGIDLIKSMNRWRGIVSQRGTYVEAFKAIRTSIF